MSKTVLVTCPHCAATLKVDVKAGVVVEHQPPIVHKDKIGFDDRLKQMQEEKERASSRLEEAMRREKSKDRIMEEKFRELMDKAKNDDGSRPVRDIDLE